jgi:BirA family biotin operon repressor/biotin-[acetyl-CoA-carboxylase] ligase
MPPPGDRTELTGGFVLHRFASLDSTNAEALRRIAAGRASPGDVILAATQEAGRGRAGRSWVSPAGNLHATVVLDVPAGRNPGQLAFVAGLGALEALRTLAPDAAFALKWPNDVLCTGRKIAGILIEAGEGAYAVGIGINLAAAPPDEAVRHPATSLRAVAGTEVPPESAVETVCAAVARWNRRWAGEGFAPLRAAWLASAHRMGDTIAASTASGTIEGRFSGLDPEGALIVETASGERHPITAGDVFFPGDA